MKEKNYIICCYKPWNIKFFVSELSKLPYSMSLISKKEDLTLEKLDKLKPRYIFLLDWSWLIEPEIYKKYECVGFHAADLPWFRGGSPIQHQILANVKKTKLSAFQIYDGIDKGGIYIKMNLSLEGSLKEIFARSIPLKKEIIVYIIENEPPPIPQTSEGTIYKRRIPSDSEIPTFDLSIPKLYDFIRMMDSPEYPLAFLRNPYDLQIEFKDAQLFKDHIVCTSIIRKKEHAL